MARAHGGRTPLARLGFQVGFVVDVLDYNFKLHFLENEARLVRQISSAL